MRLPLTVGFGCAGGNPEAQALVAQADSAKEPIGLVFEHWSAVAGGRTILTDRWRWRMEQMKPGGGALRTDGPAEGAMRPDPAWGEARKRVEAKRNFTSHAVSYGVINAFFVGIWLVTGAGYFWPAWVLGGWGVGLVMHGWDAYLRRPVTDADVEAELHRRGR